MKTKTNWYVITGGPCSGITSVCKHLSFLGYHTFSEVARIMIDQAMSQGNALEDIRSDEAVFQHKVLQEKAAFEQRLDPHALCFLDRGIPDSIAYGIPENLVRTQMNYHYRKIIFLEQVGFSKDYARTESAQRAAELGNEIYRAYTSFGYEVTRLQKMPIADRVKSVLEAIAEAAVENMLYPTLPEKLSPAETEPISEMAEKRNFSAGA